MIHVVVLAAGRGRRLGVLGDDTPKWLLDIGGRTIAEHQLAALAEVKRLSPGLIRSVRVVVGHAASAVERFVVDRNLRDVELVFNPAWEELNNWYSLLRALHSLPGGAGESVVVFNGDLLAAPDWFAQFILDCDTVRSESLIGVDTQRPLTDESMKVSVTKGDRAGNVLLDRIGKVGVEDPAGEYVGVFMVRDQARGALRAMLDSFVGSEAAADHWYEEAIGRTARQGIPWVVWPTPDSKWIEIDDEADYSAAMRMTGI